MLTAGGGRLAGVDVSDDNDVDVSLFLTAERVSGCLFEMALSLDERSHD